MELGTTSIYDVIKWKGIRCPINDDKNHGVVETGEGDIEL